MVSRDYRKEVDLSAVDRKVPWPVAVAICGTCIAAAAWCAVIFAPAAAPVEPEVSAKAVAKR